MLSTSPAVNNWRLLCGESTVHIHHFEDKFFQVLSVLCHIKQSSKYAIHKLHGQLQVSSLWKVCYLDLSVEIFLFYYKEDAPFENSKMEKRISSFSLTECLLCSPCWGLANMNRQVYSFIPSCYPMWLLGLSPNEELCKTSRDERDGEWTHLHRAYQGFNISIDNAPVPMANILKLFCSGVNIF